MSKYLVTLEIDTDRDESGDALGANRDDQERIEDGEVLDYARTFGDESGAQWDDGKRCWTQVVEIVKQP
jgi:hypothetical protein